MTAIAVVPTNAAPATSAPAATSGSREPSTDSGLFDRQLHAARQQQSTNGSSHASRQSAQGRSNAPVDKPVRESEGGATDKSSRESKGKQAGDPLHALPTVSNGTVAGTPLATPPLPASTGSDGASMPTGNQTDTDSDGDDDGAQVASGLAGSMLALLEQSAGVATSASAAATDAGSSTRAGSDGGKIVTSDASVVAGLQANGVDGGTAVTTVMTSLVNIGVVPTGNDVKPPSVDKAGGASSDLASVLALPMPATAALPATTHQLQLQPPVGSQDFASELGQQVAWLGGQDIKQARIRLNPEDLGPLDVKVSVMHGRVDVVFNAQHPAAVTAVQQSLSQLGQMLNQQGLSLGHAEVGQHDRGTHQGNGAMAADADQDDVGKIHGTGLQASVGAVSLLDAFA